MQREQNLYLVIGTRPEAIKMAPLYLALRAKPGVKVTLVSTGQHRELLHEALAEFGLAPDVDLGVMRPGQTLSGLTAAILTPLETVFASHKPDRVLIHGDTTTSFATALSCFYHGVKVSHVEAGLRSHSFTSPYPEAFNQVGVSRCQDHERSTGSDSGLLPKRKAGLFRSASRLSRPQLGGILSRP